MAANPNGGSTSLQVPDFPGYGGSRRGSDSAFTLASDFIFSTGDPLAEFSQPTSLPSSQTYSPSSQLDHLSYELQFFDARFNDFSLQYTTDQLHRVRGLLQTCLTRVEATIGSYAIPQNPALMPPASTSISSQHDRYRCLLCPEEKQWVYKSIGTFKRHVEHKHCPRYQYRCHVPGCAVILYRKDKMRLHRLRSTGHIMSATLSSGMTGPLKVQMPTPRACWRCPKTVSSWKEWFECIANHCRIPSTVSDPLSRRGSRDHGNNDGNNGGSGGGGGNIFDKAFQDHFTGGMGAQFSSFPGTGSSGTGCNFRCAAGAHDASGEETSEDGTSSDGSSSASSDAESPFFSFEESEPRSPGSGLLHTGDLPSIDPRSRPSNIHPHVSETKRPSRAETRFTEGIPPDQFHSEQALAHKSGDACPQAKASASTHLAKNERRPKLREKANIIRQLLVLQSAAAARSRRMTEVTEDVDISVSDPKPNLTWLPKPAVDLIVLEPQWLLKQLIEPFLAECETSEKSSPFWLAASRFLESIVIHE